ncbi:hypothetical protein ACTG1T_07135 [Aeromonas veronii]|uniref:hypothetical protein n=1 Tax=Aeromonas veronii TaxID=654 RepID=UPI0035B8908A
MKLIGRIEIDGVTDVICDICGGSTTIKDDYPPEFATLKAAWGIPQNMMVNLTSSISAKIVFFKRSPT